MRDPLTDEAGDEDDDRVVDVAAVEVVVVRLLRLPLDQRDVVCAEQLGEGQTDGWEDE